MLEDSQIASADALDPASGDDADFRILDLPVAPGFGGKLPPLRVRARSDGGAEAWIDTGPGTANGVGNLHGGFIAAAGEMTLFLPLYLHGRCARGGTVTVDYGVQYLAGGTIDQPLFVEIDLLRETGRMAFVRGTFRQGETRIAAFQGTIRKVRT